MHHIWVKLVSQSRLSPPSEELTVTFQDPSKRYFAAIFFTFFVRFGLFSKVACQRRQLRRRRWLAAIRTSRLAQNLLQICQKAKMESFLVLLKRWFKHGKGQIWSHFLTRFPISQNHTLCTRCWFHWLSLLTCLVLCNSVQGHHHNNHH